MTCIKVVFSFRQGIIIIMSLVASQVMGFEMSTKEPHRTTEGFEN